MKTHIIAGEETAYGYRNLTLCLRRQKKLVISFKKIYRLCKELDILAPAKRLRIKHPRRIAKNREITGPDQLWEMDIKYGYIAGEDRFFYFMGIIDVFDRTLINYHFGLSCEGKHAAQTLQGALFGVKYRINRLSRLCEQITDLSLLVMSLR